MDARPLPTTHVLWRSGVLVTKLTTHHRHNGQTCLILTNSEEVARVGIDDLQTLKEYF